MNRIGRNVLIILRAERMIARRHMTVLRNQAGMMAFAALVAGIGLIMLNVSAFIALDELVRPQIAAFMVALVNLVLAGVIMMLASSRDAEAELEPVVEVRDLAIEDLEAEVMDAIGDARDMAGNVARMARNPLGSALPAVLGPLLSSLLNHKRKK